MRGCILRTFALVFAALSINVQSSVIYDFQATGSAPGWYGSPPSIPAELAGATAWDVVGSLEFDGDLVGGFLAINGISIGTFESWDYSLVYYDDPESDPGPYGINFSVLFDGEYGPASLLMWSEDLSGGFGGPESYITSFRDIAGYTSSDVRIGSGNDFWESYAPIDGEFVLRQEPPIAEAPEPAAFLLVALGVASVIFLRRRTVAPAPMLA